MAPSVRLSVCLSRPTRRAHNFKTEGLRNFEFTNIVTNIVPRAYLLVSPLSGRSDQGHTVRLNIRIDAELFRSIPRYGMLLINFHSFGFQPRNFTVHGVRRCSEGGWQPRHNSAMLIRLSYDRRVTMHGRCVWLRTTTMQMHIVAA